MEVAGQWRREWAGTAEYGKVTEGGVTRQVARAMEVLNASAPGARVRVVRAAYHSSAGPGVPAASCLMHSSRRVISSGFNLLESPSFPTKPLEISSTPFEPSPESNTEGENYKVTEPDDFDISEPSKWKSSVGGSSIRMPSEESSSTDNASIIDLDSKTNHKSIFRKYSYDSENSDILSNRKTSARTSPLLDAPVALSTLKYKSLLNGSSDWNSRRKSYSFEDTSPLNETVVLSNDTLAMESSTDSGICKSSEIVNDTDDKFYDRREKKYEKPEENFKDWLSKNRRSSYYKGNNKSYREHDVVLEHPLENSIALQSTGKLSITVPITVESDDEYRRRRVTEENDRKIKKVEFCKTELHFAAESGKVNIIATDEKPPPSNDFRKRRSAFVPIHGNFEKPITLFGESNKDYPEGTGEFPTFANTEICEFDENTAATKSILKNKIPKPKPYLLGENMVFGPTDNITNKRDSVNINSPVPTAVTLINRQLQTRRHSDEATMEFINETDIGVINTNSFRTTNKGPSRNDNSKYRKTQLEYEFTTSGNHILEDTKYNNDSARIKMKDLQMSPEQGRAKIRQLRDSDLTYFGIDRSPNRMTERVNPRNTTEIKPTYDCKFQADTNGLEDFHSVRLIQQVSISACNSEAESEPDYQNIPIKTNFAPVPTPRSRSKYEGNQEIRILKPVIEQDTEIKLRVSDSRRSRHKRQDETSTTSSRSISEPPKINRLNTVEKPSRRYHLRTNMKTHSPSPSRLDKIYTDENINNHFGKSPITIRKGNVTKDLREDNDPLYVNLSVEDNTKQTTSRRTDSNCRTTDRQRKSHANSDINTNRSEHKTDTIKSHRQGNHADKQDKAKREKPGSDKDSLQRNQQSLKKKAHKQRTEKLSTPEYPTNQRKPYDKLSSTRKSLPEKKEIEEKEILNKSKQEHRSRSSQRRSTQTGLDKFSNDLNKVEDKYSKEVGNEVHQNNNLSHGTRHLSKDKTSSRQESSKADKKLNTSSSDTYHNTTGSKNKDIHTTEKISKADYKTSKRSEYVINYDDKNGTVSSICKVKLGPGTSKKKKTLKEITKDPKEHKANIKTAEHISLLQLPDRHWNSKGQSYADKKCKRVHVQRTCQLL